MIDFLKEKFGKKEKEDVVYGVVEWGDAAKSSAMGIPTLKKLVIYRGKTPVNEEPYNEAKIQQYKRQIKIFDNTEGERIPKDSVTTPFNSEVAVAITRTRQVSPGEA